MDIIGLIIYLGIIVLLFPVYHKYYNKKEKEKRDND